MCIRDSLQHFGKDFQSMNGMSSADRIFEWLKSKWSQLYEADDKQDQFCNFMCWLGNKYDPKDPFNDRKHRRMNGIPSSWNENSEVWQHFREQRQFLLGMKLEKKSKCLNTPFFNLPKVALNITRYNDTLYRLLENAESEALSSPLQKFTWAAKLLQIVDNLSGDSTFSEFISAYNRTIAITIPKLNLDNQTSYDFFFDEVLSIRTVNVDHLVFDKIDMKSIVDDFIGLQKKKPQAGVTIVNYFETSSEEAAQNINPYEIESKFQKPHHSTMDKVLEAYLWASKGKSFSERLMAILEFSDLITTDVFISYLSTVCLWLKQTIADRSSYKKVLEEFTEVLGEKLLCNHYSSSNQAMFLLTSYIEAIRPQWLSYPCLLYTSRCV